MLMSGALLTCGRVKAGISGASSRSKSIEGTTLNRPSVSLTAADIICQMGCSFSNLISVLVG